MGISDSNLQKRCCIINFSDLETLKENMMHSNIQTTDSLYGIFDKKNIKERIHSLDNSEEIYLLEEIPPQDRQFDLSLYRVYKEKHSE